MEVLKDNNIISKLNDKTFLFTIKTSLTKNDLIEHFKEYGIDVKVFLELFKDDFNLGIVEYIELDEGTLFIYKSNKDYFITLKNEKLTTLINHNDKIFGYCDDGKDIECDIHKTKKFIDLLASLSKKYTSAILYNYLDLYDDTNLVDEDSYNKVIEDEVIQLMLLKFRLEDNGWMKLIIVLKETMEEVGYIEFNLKDNNFSYRGNVEYEIKEKYRNKGYATRALAMVKKLVTDYQKEVDKCLYIATVKDNYASQQVILNNGGKLFYEGEVPKNSRAYIYNKVDYVKIYTIDANSLQE